MTWVRIYHYIIFFFCECVHDGHILVRHTVQTINGTGIDGLVINTHIVDTAMKLEPKAIGSPYP